MINQAHQAYITNNVELSKKAHQVDDNVEAQNQNPNPEDQPLVVADHKEQHQSGGEYIKSAVYGGMDGLVTTFSVVAGVAGAGLPVGVVLAMGIANLIGDGISMALGDFISTKSEAEFTINERNREAWEVDNNPDGEKKEMIDIYKEKGIEHDDAVLITETLAKNKKVWIDVMMVEELGLMSVDENPVKDALVTFVSFLFFGIMPIIPFIVGKLADYRDNLFIVSLIMTGVFLFILGVCKSMFSYEKWYFAGIETLLVGAAAAASSYVIGLAFDGLQV